MSQWLDGVIAAEQDFKRMLREHKAIVGVDGAFNMLLDKNRNLLEREYVVSEHTQGRVDYACHINYLRISGRLESYVSLA